LAPLANSAVEGTTASDARAADVTVKVVVAETFPNAAVMAVDPVTRDVAKPTAPALLTEATLESDEVQATDVVRSCTESSEYVPAAVNCWVLPSGILGFAGVIAMDVSMVGDTVKVVEAVAAPRAAVMVADPGPMPAAKPLKPSALLTAAMPVLPEVQVANEVTSCLEPFAKVAIAVNC